MKNSPSFNIIPQRSGRINLVLIAFSAVILLGIGCRQSGSGAQFGKAGPFGSGNGVDNSYASNNRQRSSYIGNQPVNGALANQPNSALAGEMQSLTRRLESFDADNQSLNTEVASLQLKLQTANQYNHALKQQLSDTSSRIRQSDLDRQNAIQQFQSSESKYQQLVKDGAASRDRTSQQVGFGGGTAPTGFSGGATIRANNSLVQQMSGLQIPGSQIRMDGDVIRIEIPTDRLFVPGSYRIQPSQLPLLQNISATIRRNFPRQLIGIEGHWDKTPLNPATTTHHQLTATQALSVFDNLVKLGVPESQLFTTSMASNRPRYPQGVTNGVSANRRIELVIYPETIGN